MAAAEPTGQWCDDCGRLIVPVVEPDGGHSCPRCGKRLAAFADAAVEPVDEGARTRPPWHFKVLLAGTIGYLIYRVIWFIGWISHHA